MWLKASTRYQHAAIIEARLLNRCRTEPTPRADNALSVTKRPAKHSSPRVKERPDAVMPARRLSSVARFHVVQRPLKCIAHRAHRSDGLLPATGDRISAVVRP